MIKHYVLAALLASPLFAASFRAQTIQGVSQAMNTASNVAFKTSDLKRVTAASEVIMFANFEDAGLPAGWEAEGTPAWQRVQAEAFSQITAWSGSGLAAVEVDANVNADTKLITKSFTALDNTLLTFHVKLNPLRFFDCNVAMRDYTDGVQTKVADFKVLLSIDGGEWHEVESFAKKCEGLSYQEVMALPWWSQYGEFTYDFSAYTGRNLRIAFAYEGACKLGGFAYLDDVKVYTRETTGANFLPPANTLFLMQDAEGNFVEEPTYLFPAYNTEEFRNLSLNRKSQFTWTYSAPNKGGQVQTSTDKDLKLITTMAYENDAPRVFDAPSLKAAAENYTTSETNGLATKMVFDVPEVGGVNYGVSFFPQSDDRIIIKTDNIKQIETFMENTWTFHDIPEGTPLYGFSKGANEWWTQYCFADNTLRGQELNEGDEAHMCAFMSYFPQTEKPFVINGINLYAQMQAKPGAELQIDIYPNREDAHYGDEFGTEPYRTVICKYEDFKGNDPQSINDVFIHVDLDEPLVVHETLRLNVLGFDEPKYFTYFAPYQTKEVDMEYDYDGEGRTLSMMCRQMVYGGDVYWNWGIAPGGVDESYWVNAFYLYPSGYYPHFTDAEGDHTFVADAENKSTTYHFPESTVAPEDFIVKANTADGTLPDWLNVDFTGRYLAQDMTITTSKAVLHIAPGAVEPTYTECVLTVEVPGQNPVHYTVRQKDIEVLHDGEPDAITEIVTDKRFVTYDLAGRRVNNTARGIFIQDGRKVIR